MKDFDVDRHQPDPPLSERQFKLHGHTFTIRSVVQPEAAALIEDAGARGMSSIETLQQIDQGVMLYLIDEDAEAWQTIRADRVDPVTLSDMLFVAEWLMEVESRRPTRAPSASSDGRADGNGSSTEQSSSPEATQTG